MATRGFPTNFLIYLWDHQNRIVKQNIPIFSQIIKDGKVVYPILSVIDDQIFLGTFEKDTCKRKNKINIEGNEAKE